MSRPRVAIITRRFWPLVGETENSMAALAVGLREAELTPTVVTARWRPIWPGSFAYEDVPVVRLPPPARGRWGDWSYARRVGKWLKQHRREFDVALVPAHEPGAATVMESLRKSGVATVLLSQGRTDHSAGASRKAGWFRWGDRLADAVVTTDEGARQAWIASGYASAQVRIIRPGVPIPPAPSSNRRRAARKAVAKFDRNERLTPLMPLAVYVGPLRADRNLPLILSTWTHIAKRYPDARLWLFGRGPMRMQLHEQIEQMQLTAHVAMPGVIDDAEDLLAAADLFIAPGDETIFSSEVLSAMASGLPVVASDTEAHRRLITNNQHGLLFDSKEPNTARESIERLLSQPTLAATLGENARRRVKSEFALENAVEQFVELFEALGDRKERG